MPGDHLPVSAQRLGPVPSVHCETPQHQGPLEDPPWGGTATWTHPLTSSRASVPGTVVAPGNSWSQVWSAGEGGYTFLASLAVQGEEAGVASPTCLSEILEPEEMVGRVLERKQRRVCVCVWWCQLLGLLSARDTGLR